MLSYSIQVGEFMDIQTEELDISNFELESSSEVDTVISQVKRVGKKDMLIQIASYIHNTVLVQNLIKEITKAFPDTKIVLLKHEDKTKTKINIFRLKHSIESEDLDARVLSQLYALYLKKYESESKYRHQLFSRYFTDHLTNLPNVYQLRKDFQTDEKQGLVLIKIDNFLTINNFYGFVVGDLVIEEIAKYLKETLCEHKVYRLSGAEFAFSIDKQLEFYELKKYLTEIYEKINSYFVRYQNSKIFIDFTLASSAVPSMENIFSKVSVALGYAKEIGVPFWIYEDRMNFENNYKRNLELSEVVRKCISKSRIVPYFQAIINNKTDKIEKYECLARLLDNNDNIISPLVFIPIAKKIKAYYQITIQMIEKSFAAFEDNEFEFSINLSIIDIMNSDVFHFLIHKLQTSTASSRVTFEILESESINDFNKIEKFITEIKRYGAKVAIDNFGSGYSNFSYLIKIKADYIKIDGSLIENIHIDNASLVVVETIVAFAKKLGMKTVAEYVHCSAVMDKVKELGIDYSQGFYIDKPTLHKDIC